MGSATIPHLNVKNKLLGRYSIGARSVTRLRDPCPVHVCEYNSIGTLFSIYF
jgi:hypothetical protein